MLGRFPQRGRALGALLLLTLGAAWPRQAPAPTRDPAPREVALLAGGTAALVTERGTGTLAQVDLATGQVRARLAVGTEPFAVATDGTRAVVSCYADDTVAVVAVKDGLRLAATIPVGAEPRGVALSPDGATAYVALAGDDAIAVVDLAARKVVQRLPVGLEPWFVAVTPDGKRLAVGTTRSRELQVIALRGGGGYTVPLLGRNVRAVGVSPDGRYAFVPFINERKFPANKLNIDRGWVVGNRLARVELTDEGPREAIALDTQGDAVGDIDGCTVAPDGKTLALTAGGTHEVLLFARPEGLPFVAYGGPEDYLEPESVERLRRVKTGGRPLGARFTPDGKKLIVANDFLNAIQVIDIASARVERTITLGGPKEPSRERRGEMLFCDAKRSFHFWYSCYSCHTEGHTNGGNFDTLNDGGYGKPKKTPSLRGVAQTAPYTWHGWQKSLRQAIVESFVNSMQGERPTEAELDAIEAYMRSLTWRPSRVAATEPAVIRGKKVFDAKGCASCHSGPSYASSDILTVGLEEADDAYKGFNPPSLRNVGHRAPYLHDGRAATLDDVLTRYHRPSQLAGQSDCTPAELRDLIAFLKSL